MTSSESKDLGRSDLQQLFRELDEGLRSREETAQLFVVGGAAMALEYSGGRVTKDVDALFEPSTVVRELSVEIGHRHGIDADWINDGAKGFMPGNDEAPHTVFSTDNLLVQVASAEYLLAMKLYATRDERDIDDAAFLCNYLGYSSARQCIDLLEGKYPARMLQPRHNYVAKAVAIRASQQLDDRRRSTGTLHGSHVPRFDDPGSFPPPGPGGPGAGPQVH